MARLIVPVLIGVLGVGVLVALGQWQLDRLAWKESVLAEIDARIAAAPVPVPERPDPESDRYLPVRTAGLITDEEAHVLVSTREAGPAFRIISRFEADDGRSLLVDRGYVDDQDKDGRRDPVRAELTGNLHWPDEVDRFTPQTDTVGNVWFARDVGQLSAALGTESVLIVVRSTSESDPTVTPLPVDSAGIPNDHLEYAVTWFGLALVWAGMTVFWIFRLKRGRS